MNERIEELSDQARQCCRAQQCVDNAFLEKFAELIVQECADVCINKYAKSDNMSRQSGINFGKDIKQHFGVEE